MLEKFRKYQGALLVLFGVFLMFSFVIAPPLNDYLAQQAMIQTGNYEAVVTWVDADKNKVTLNEVDLQREYETHVLTVRFLQTLLDAAHARNLPTTPAEQQRAQGRRFKLESPIQFNEGTGQFERTDLPGSPKVTFEIPSIVTNEAALVRKLMFVQEAKRTGIRVTDDTVTTYLENIASMTVAGDQVDAIRKQTSDQLSRALLYEQLKKELLAQKYRKLTVEWVNARPTPGQERAYFDRVNRQIKVAVVPFPVEEYMAQIDDPDDAAILQQFNAYKDRIQNPLDDEPGFKERDKMSWAYIAADLAPFIAAALPAAREAITDQEIEERYENAKSGQMTSYAWHPPYTAPQETEGTSEQPPEPSSSETSSTTTPAADDAAPAAAATPQDSQPPAKPAETPAPEDAKPAPAPQKEADQKEADQGQADRSSTATRFVAAGSPQDAPPEAEQTPAQPTSETPTQDAAEPDSGNQPANEAAIPPDETPTTDTPPATAGDNAAAVPEPPTPPLDAKPEEQPVTSTEPKLTRVLDGDLREQIRGELAEAKAREQGRQLMTEKLETILPAVRSYQRKRNRWRVHIGRLLKQATDDEGAETSGSTADEDAKSDRMLSQELDSVWGTLLKKINASKVIPVDELAKENLGALERWAKEDGDPQNLSLSDLKQPALPDPVQLAKKAHPFLRGGKLALLTDLEFAENEDLNDLPRRFEDLIGPMQQMNAQVQQAQQFLNQAIAEKGADSSEALFARNQLQQTQSQSQNFQQQLFSMMQQPFSQFAYAAAYVPFQTVQLQKNTPAGEPVEFLVWKTDEQAERTPDLKEPGVEEKVKESLRREKARKLAEEAANKLRTEIMNSGDESLVIDYLVPQATDSDPSQNVTPAETYASLAAFSDRAEVTTNFFSWLQSTPAFGGMPGNAPPAPTVSTLMVVKPARPTVPRTPDAPAPESPAPETDAKGDCVTQPPAGEKSAEAAADTDTAEQETAEQETAEQDEASEQVGTAEAPPSTDAAAAVETAETAAEVTAPALPSTLPEIGRKFMQPVFSVNPGEFAIAWNEPKTVCYLVQITAQQQPTKELHKRFVEKRFNLPQQSDTQIDQIHRQEVLQTVQGLFEEFDRRLEVAWPGRPDDRGTTPYGQR